MKFVTKATTLQKILVAVSALLMIRCGIGIEERSDQQASNAQATHDAASFRTAKNVNVAVAPQLDQDIGEHDLPTMAKMVYIDFECTETTCPCNQETCEPTQPPGSEGKATVFRALADFRTHVKTIRFWTNERGNGDARLDVVTVFFTDGTTERLENLETTYPASSGNTSQKHDLTLTEKTIAQIVVVGQNFTLSGGRLRFNIEFEIRDAP